MCKLMIAVTVLASIPVLFALKAEAATPGPISVLAGTAKSESLVDSAVACARRRVCGPRGCVWRSACAGRRW